MADTFQGGIGGEMLPLSTKGKATATTRTKKRAASEKSAAAEHEDGEAFTKKARVVKKGTAKLVKKSNAKVDSGSEDEEKLRTKPKEKDKDDIATRNGKRKAPTKPSGSAKTRKGKADTVVKAGQIPIDEDEDADVDIIGGDGHQEGRRDMQFDESA